jgi:hypothetical protein
MKKLNKIISGLVIGGTILSASTLAMADTTKTANANKGFQGRPPIAGKMMRGGDMKPGGMQVNIQDELKSLVSAGIITQGESDKILALSQQEAKDRQAEVDKIKSMTDAERKAYFESKKGTAPEFKGDIYMQAVSGGIITQDKADAIKTKLQETRQAEMKAKMTQGLSSLVTPGTITQAQADKVIAYITSQEANRKADFDKTAGTKTEQKPDPTTARKSPLSSLVSDGTLTQAQADAILKALPMGGGHGHGGPGGHGGPHMDGGKAPTATN